MSGAINLLLLKAALDVIQKPRRVCQRVGTVCLNTEGCGYNQKKRTTRQIFDQPS